MFFVQMGKCEHFVKQVDRIRIALLHVLSLLLLYFVLFFIFITAIYNFGFFIHPPIFLCWVKKINNLSVGEK